MEQLPRSLPFVHTNALRLLFYPFSASISHVWFGTGFHVGFKVPSWIQVLAVRVLYVLEHLFFLQFVRFRFVQVSSTPDFAVMHFGFLAI